MIATRATAALYHPDADRGTDALDLASAYLRRAGVAAALCYLPAAVPVLVAGAWWIGVVTTGDRAALSAASLALAAAWGLRWALLVPLYARVMRHVGLRPRVTARTVVATVAARLAAQPLIVWGGLLVLPGVWGWCFSSLVTPSVLGTDGPAVGGVREANRLAGLRSTRLLRLSSAAAALAAVGVLAAVVTKLTLVFSVMPALTGHDLTGIKLAMGGPAWWLGCGLAAILLYDFVWTVASVFLANELEAQRSGRDLRLRLDHLKAETP